ncbi:MAG TPA: hypothetical protein VMH27_03385 [Puia sp.]|nr:hypothetical protein [Puia sp.]
MPRQPHHPQTKSFPESPPLRFRVVQAVVLVLAVASMSAWVFLDFNLDNFSLAWIGVLLGIVIGALFEWWLERKFPMLKKFEKLKKSSIGVLVVLIFIDLMPLAAQEFNSRFFNTQLTCKDYPVLSKSGDKNPHYLFYRHWSGYHIHLLIDSVKKDIDCDEDFYHSVKVGKTVTVCTAKGAFGIWHIKKMEAN